ncbi:MAG: Peptidoglycan D,D-transpeptidase MrdA [Firmicutes bacterium]|nr:Peptidoglycan D,D-transpeptidase MrdA [Bacillota bacterium]MDI6706522.1 penicillin-binding protein 2 [Bacillota bacterium]
MFWKKLLDRHNLIALFLGLLAFALVFRLVQLQIVQGEYYNDLSENKRIRRIVIEAPRGAFLDRFGREIAGNRPGYVIEIVKTEIVDEKINYVVQKTVEILERNGEKVKADFPINIETMEYKFSSKTQEQEWKKRYGVPADYSAGEAYRFLREKNSIPDETPDHMAVMVLGVLQSIKEQGYRSYQPIEIARDVSMETVAQIEERHMDLPGVNVEVKPIRYYREGSLAAHVLGYLGNINQDELERLKDKGYDQNDFIGKSGLEKVLEEELKGVDGYKQVEVDAYGRLVRTLGENPPVLGNNVFLTLDARLQRTAEKAMEDTLRNIQEGKLGEKFPNARSGAVVAMDVHTGEVLALASYPAYDPNLFSTGISSQDWIALNPQTSNPMDPRPMYNNAIQAALPPGSTFKMVVGIAGMQEGVVTPKTIIVDRGVYTKIPGASPACWIWNSRRGTHGPETMWEAIRDSCNYYFFEVSRLLGIKNMEKYANMFGLGVKTGIELPGEASGVAAGPTYKAAVWKNAVKRYMTADMGVEDEDLIKGVQDLVGEDFGSWNQLRKSIVDLGITDNTHINKLITLINSGRWTPGQTLSAAIGQGEHMFTPLQMANYIATVANGGTRYKPHLIKKVYDQSTGEYKVKEPEVVERIEISPENLDAVFKGMNAVTRPGGTASSAFRGLPVEVAGKTGTVQNPGYDDNAWFVGFAPYDNPQIAVAVVIFQGGHGSYAAPVARAIFEDYLGINMQGTKLEPTNALTR